MTRGFKSHSPRHFNQKDVVPLSPYDITISREDYEVFCMIAEEEIARAINSQNSYVIQLMNHVMAIVGTHVPGTSI